MESLNSSHKIESESNVNLTQKQLEKLEQIAIMGIVSPLDTLDDIERNQNNKAALVWDYFKKLEKNQLIIENS